MTISYVAAGTSATGNNTSVSPGLPTGAQAGDTIIIVASIRNSGTGTVDLPDDWTSLVEAGNVRVMARIYDGSWSMPTVTFSDGTAGATTIGDSFAVRGADPNLLTILSGTPGTVLSGSAQNIATPGLSIADNGVMVLRIGWKQDDWSSITTPNTYTAGPQTSSTLGNDAAQATFYKIENVTTLGTGSLTVTGGASAISRSIALALRSAPAFTADEQDVWPPRVLLSLTGLAVGDGVAVYRQVGGQRTLVRAGQSDAVVDSSFLVIDAELPFGTPVTYVAVVNDEWEYTAGPSTYTLPGGRVAISDAISGTAAEVVISAWPEKTRSRQSSVFRVGGRNVAVLGPLVGFEADIEIYTETTSARDNLYTVLENATEGVVQIRQPGTKAYDGVDSYVAVLDVTERRHSQDGSDPRRITAMRVVETEAWAPALEARGYTYADLDALYDGLTYADLAVDYATYLDLAQAELE